VEFKQLEVVEVDKSSSSKNKNIKTDTSNKGKAVAATNNNNNNSHNNNNNNNNKNIVNQNKGTCLTGTAGTSTSNKNKNSKKSVKQVNIMDKPMTMDEKNALGADIRTLNPNQLRGIIGILSDPKDVDQNLKFFEFDIENLAVRKLRELEKYVKGCLQEANKSKGTHNLSENQKIQQLKVLCIV